MTSDPHSFTDLSQGRIVDLSLRWLVDFERHQLKGSVEIQLAEAAAGPLDLDTRDLAIESVEDANGQALPFELGERDDVLGQRLRIVREEPCSRLHIRYATSTTASGLIWLEPAQTASGKYPFVLSQCQPAHARSLVPVQDSPQVRIRYRAELRVPAELKAVMSAAPGVEQGEVEQGQKTICFDMPQPVPAYLLALAVGELESADLGPRTRVFAEPSVLEAAVWEYADVEKMLAAAEELFGPYRWDRYDFIVLPPSFPMGGMENPRMTFLTPTLLAGDRSLVSVLAHELAHSWTGNLVTNATNEHFWLNEGWTVYAERRILEAIYGEEPARQEARLGRLVLEEQIVELNALKKSTALCYEQKGLDPDEELTKIPYEKGFLFISLLEQTVGRERFDRFVLRYMDRFAFQSLTTEGFTEFVKTELPEVARLNLQEWLYEEGLPNNAPEFVSQRLDELRDYAIDWAKDKQLRDCSEWTTTEKLYFLVELPELDASGTKRLGAWMKLPETRNAELQCVWLSRAALAELEEVEGQLRDFVGSIGRTKLLKPVLAAMLRSGDYHDLAVELYRANATRLHSSTRLAVESLLKTKATASPAAAV